MRDIGIDDPGGDGASGGGYTPPPAQAGQGWTIDATADTITFSVPPLSGTGNVIVNEYGVGTQFGSSKFAIGSWNGKYGYPSEVEFFADRLWWANTPTDPQMIWASQTGDYSNYGRSTPIVDSDAISFAINSRQVNAVMDLVPLDKMIALTTGGEFLMKGGQEDVVTPSSVSMKPQSYLGTGGLQARVAGDTAVFVQQQGQHVFDIGYKFESDGYKPTDISAWSAHLVQGYEITFMEWMPAPWNVMWFGRNDGVVLGCTYMPAQEVIGWHRHDTGRDRLTEIGDDDIDEIVCLPGTTQTEVIALVTRVVDGVERSYLEQLSPLFVDDIRDWCYLDSSVTYDGRNESATTVTITGGTSWSETETLTLTSSAALFAGISDIGDGFAFKIGGEWKRVIITGFISPTVVTVNSVGDLPVELRGAATVDWVLQRDSIAGLDHLEGRTVGILLDGSVHGQRVVADGKVTLDYPGGVVTIGLPFRAHIETLPLNNPGADTLMDAKKLLNSVSLLVQNTRGVKVCAGTLRDDYTYDIPQRELEDYGEATRPVTGYMEAPVSAEWGQDTGHFHVFSDDPLPMEVLGMVTSFMAGKKVV